MFVIGEKINVLNARVYEGVVSGDLSPAVSLAILQAESGADALDINLGPDPRNGEAIMKELVMLVQQHVDLPLCLNGTPEIIGAGLAVHKGRAIINGVTGERERMERLLDLAVEFNARIIGMAVPGRGHAEGMDSRGVIAVEIAEEAVHRGIDVSDIYMDPLLDSFALKPSVLVLINGRPVSAGQYGSVNLGSLPIETVSRVVVFKPPVPVWLGPGAVAGAINIETEHIEERDTGSKGKKVQLKANSGSYGTVNASVSYGSALPEGNIELTAGGGHRDGKRPNSDKDSGYLNLHWDKTTESFTTYNLDSRYYYAGHGSAGPTYNPTPDARQQYQKGSLDFRIKRILDETHDFSVKAYLDMADLEDTSQTGSISTLDTVKLGLKGETVWSEMDGSRALRLGGLIEGDTVDHTISGKHDRGKVSVHTQLDKNFGEMTASLGLRGDYVSDFGLFPAFSSGLTYAVGYKSLVKANGGYSVKVPTFGRLYQPSHGSIDQVRGNPDLREEDVWSYDIGVEHTFDKERVFQATLFRSDHQDLIAYPRGADLISSPVNVAKAFRQGLELTLEYTFSKNLDGDFSYIYQKSKIRGTGTELAYTPRQKAKIALKYTLPDWKTRCQTTIRAVSRQFSDIENKPDEELDGYTTVDIKIRQPLTIASRSSEMYVDIKNLFDTDFESHYGYPDDGIRFIAGVNMKF